VREQSVKVAGGKKKRPAPRQRRNKNGQGWPSSGTEKEEMKSETRQGKQDAGNRSQCAGARGLELGRSHGGVGESLARKGQPGTKETRIALCGSLTAPVASRTGPDRFPALTFQVRKRDSQRNPGKAGQRQKGRRGLGCTAGGGSSRTQTTSGPQGDVPEMPTRRR